MNTRGWGFVCDTPAAGVLSLVLRCRGAETGVKSQFVWVLLTAQSDGG